MQPIHPANATSRPSTSEARTQTEERAADKSFESAIEEEAKATRKEELGQTADEASENALPSSDVRAGETDGDGVASKVSEAHTSRENSKTSANGMAQASSAVADETVSPSQGAQGHTTQSASNQGKPVSPISAMVQGLSQRGMTTRPETATGSHSPDNPKTSEAEHLARNAQATADLQTTTGRQPSRASNQVEMSARSATRHDPQLGTSMQPATADHRTHATHIDISTPRLQPANVHGAASEYSSRETLIASKVIAGGSQTGHVQGASKSASATVSSAPTKTNDSFLQAAEPTARTTDAKKADGAATTAGANTLTPARVTSEGHTTATLQAQSAVVSDPLSSLHISSEAEVSIQSEEFLWDLRSNASVHSGKSTPPMLRAELPQHISHAIADAFRRAPDKPIEIALGSGLIASR